MMQTESVGSGMTVPAGPPGTIIPPPGEEHTTWLRSNFVIECRLLEPLASIYKTLDCVDVGWWKRVRHSAARWHQLGSTSEL